MSVVFQRNYHIESLSYVTFDIVIPPVEHYMAHEIYGILVGGMTSSMQ